MVNRRIQSRALLVLAAGVFLAPGCALRFKVSEDWDMNRDDPIPLSEARAAWEDIRAGRVPSNEELEIYNTAVRDSVSQIAANWQENKAALSRIRTTDGREVDLRVNSLNVWQVERIDQVIPSEFVRLRRGFDDGERVTVEGAGVSLTVRQAWTESDSMIPETGLWYPLTGLLDLDQPDRPVLQLVDPTRTPDLRRGGRAIPLAVDYTSAFARDFQDRQQIFDDAAALLRFEKFAERMGMYRISPFDPEKEVCLLIHGINSTPITWNQFLNAAYEHPEIRERYEFWTFGYPTGAPVPYLASNLRKSIREMLEFRGRNGAGDRSVTIVGHSMGGLLAKAVTQHGGDEDWNKLFNVPIGELEVSESKRKILRDLVYYEPIAEVDRVFFLNTPHRGSQLAANPGAKLIGDLVQIPRSLATVTNEIVKQSRYALTPLGLELAKMPSSVDQLRPSSRFTSAFLEKPLNPQVEFHSVIGRNDNGSGPLEKSTDGVVPYTSSHLEGVATETIVTHAKHGIHRVDAGIEAIIGLLKLP